jgi:hypothetical protein
VGVRSSLDPQSSIFNLPFGVFRVFRGLDLSGILDVVRRFGQSKCPILRTRSLRPHTVLDATAPHSAS